MLGVLRQKVYPIGVDLGSCSLKLVQLTRNGNGLSLVAAARADVPREIQDIPSERQEWYIDSFRELLASKPFKGRRVISCLAAREMLVQHLRVPKMDEDHLEKALPWEAQGKVPFNINTARLHHIVAGEVYDGAECKQEVILMAASATVVKQHLNLIERTKVQVDSINVEPLALVNCFLHLLEKDNEQQKGTMLIDLGHSCSKVVITHGADIAFCRTIGIGAEQMVRAICDKLSVDYAEASRLYLDYFLNVGRAEQERKARAAAPEVEREVGGAAVVPQGAAATATEEESLEVRVKQAITLSQQNLAEEIRSCVRYHDLVFGSQPVGRTIFVGGQAKNKSLCRQLARHLGLPAQLGDPLARIEPSSLNGKHSDLVADERHCDWAVAFGLSLGGIELK
ncbi:MAG: pilus assembly protein PilM [Planctomycetes bacterium]|nr:pilus assembly protein PilM [Planctomycetota bacterium]